jgi:hypothetical protein
VGAILISSLPAMTGMDAWLVMLGAQGMVRVNLTFAVSPVVPASLMDATPYETDSRVRLTSTR